MRIYWDEARCASLGMCEEEAPEAFEVGADGVLVLHLSNRNLDLNGPALAVAKAAGGVAMIQHYRPAPGADMGGWPSREDAVIIARSPAGLAPFVQDRRWRTADGSKVRPWTDDYTNLFGALWRRLQERLDPTSDS